MALALVHGNVTAAEVAVPKVRDDRLQITLVASEPQIVTPIGIAVDQRNRLFVVESHTHHRPENYQGPEADLVKVFTDTNGDGIPDTPQVFAEGFNSAMNLAVSPADELYLVHRSGVVLLHDEDHNGVAEKRTVIVEMISPQDYPHNGLSGITFSHSGWLYLGLGENFGAEYTLRGTDGRTLQNGPGRGGKVFRCRADGSELEEVATGFWNPFGLELDRAERLFCVDNDSGGRPPCRLLHVVPHGDYGYKRRYEDNHVFNGWNGELPGTLPMLIGTGEAPCGILSCDRLAFPGSYAGAMLVGSWGDAAIELYRMTPDGASFRATKENLVEGERKFNEAFCPVNLAPAPDGSLYISDWADRTSYPVHGKGRIWRLAAKPGVAVKKPDHAVRLAETNKEALRFHRLQDAQASPGWEEIRKALTDADPFIRSAAITALARPANRDKAQEALKDATPEVRLGALSAQWRSKSENAAALLNRALSDSDDRIRFLALWWAGEDAVDGQEGAMQKAVAQQPSPLLFQAYLSAAELLAVSRAEPGVKGEAPKPAAAVRQEMLSRILHDDSQPASLHAMAAATVTSLSDAKTAGRLMHFARHGDESLQREAIRTLGGCPQPQVPGLLKAIALDTAVSAGLRADAVVSLTRRDVTQLAALCPLLEDRDPQVQIEAARALRLVASETMVRTALQAKLAALKDNTSALAEQLRFALPSTADQGSAPKRPGSPEAWRQALASGGDAESGRRVFLSAQANCTMCHRAQERGVSIGPDLTHVGRSLDRARLIEAILDPSREVAPQYEQHFVTTKSGEFYSGVLVHSALDGAPLIHALGVGRIRVPMAKVAEHKTSPFSLMPAGLENTMTVQDFRDLLAYLLTLQ